MGNVVQHLKALADETRLKLLTLLAERPCCVCELAEVLNMSQPTITRHLQKLLDAGFLRTKKCENFQIYWIEPRGKKKRRSSQKVLRGSELWTGKKKLNISCLDFQRFSSSTSFHPGKGYSQGSKKDCCLPTGMQKSMLYYASFQPSS